ncbi:class I SAM-dependent methyltransferase [Streptococcus infantarius]|uniref:class I SAM-dependent methyltransferase n=1 Tax=Streptococcus infantarius TaxID=102684 RepID=UPI00208EC768|nr:class I SAM-dependent methyltransferase [Streptococcus infantarius]MCO4502524.1 Methylase involved in ubiquinone/menaquinone biosynthesis [Streptococcus infantarius subsp. infantarius]MCO4505489.1 Methylase involved in ubiquinone/menaquinone biosynthesis [Streptococcus infantarius subsp. infantarius]MCY7242310.1 class I SAM-dependent methyltransferase [Streptococcus infantarius]
MADKIKKAYRASKGIYDDVLTQRSLFSKLYIKLFWSGVDDNKIARVILDYIPEDFSSALLDVPVGTAVFTQEKWKRLLNANIICLDYSEDMILQAKKRLENYSHILCMQGDVGELPLENSSCDIVLSMNGFHAFPNKNQAFQEIWRVVKPGGKFIDCFYIKGKSKITDWLVKNILSKEGWFTPPFQTEKQLKDLLENLYSKINLHTEGSMVYFECIK